MPLSRLLQGRELLNFSKFLILKKAEFIIWTLLLLIYFVSLCVCVCACVIGCVLTVLYVVPLCYNGTKVHSPLYCIIFYSITLSLILYPFLTEVHCPLYCTPFLQKYTVLYVVPSSYRSTLSFMLYLLLQKYTVFYVVPSS